MLASQQVRQAREPRYAWLAGLTLAGFGLVVVGLLRLQVVDHEKYLELSKENRVRLEVLRAPRGAIYDRNGNLLADSAPSFSIVFRPFPAESTHLARITRDGRWTRRVASLLDADADDIGDAVAAANRSGQSAILRRDAPFALLAGVEEVRSELPGIEVQVEPLRRYPHGALASHLLGYAGEVNDLELDSLAASGYRPGDLIGRSGIERRYEEFLRGRDGAEFVVVNASGKRAATLSEEPPRLPVNGHDLVLTIDLKVQRAMEDAMANVARGAAVALDPRDGSVLGMVSRPAFDPNEFSHGLSVDRWRELSGGDSNPLLNRAIQGTYPPGSTFKILTMLASLRAGVAGATTRLQPCPGYYAFGGRTFGCWKRTGHGSLDFIEALQNSCDVYFYQLGPRLGLPRLEEAAREFGLGARTGVDLPQERGGLIPSTAYYDKRWGAGRWRSGLLLNLAIGQGELLLTPLQLALLAAEAANGGHALRPHIVKEVRGEEAYKPDRPIQPGFTADDAVWRTAHEAMERVVDSGTGTAARVPGLRVAGKTGTAQNPHGNDHALFVCYAPADAPQIAMAFVIENSGHGGSIAAPMAGQVLAKLFLPDSLRAKVRLPVAVAPLDTAEVIRGD